MTGSAAKRAEPDLADLLQAVASGDRCAYRRLYDLSSAALFPICLRLMREREAAKDVFQEALLRIWQKAHLYDRSKGAPMAWMAVLTRNCALSRLAVAAPPAASLDDEAVLAAVEEKTVSDPMAGAGVRACLKRLNEKYRKCVVLIHLYGLSYEELAVGMEAPVGTVKTWVHRALKELALCLEK